MSLKPLLRPKLIQIEQEPTPEQKQAQRATERATKAQSKKRLPPDEYADEFAPSEMLIDEVKKVVISVKRGGVFGLPLCDLRQYETTPIYTGYVNKGINLPIELIPNLIEALQETLDNCYQNDLM